MFFTALFTFISITNPVSASCIKYASHFLKANYLHHLEIEVGSFADNNPQLAKRLLEIYKSIPKDKEIILKNPMILKRDAFILIIDVKREMAEQLRSIANETNNSILKRAILKSATSIDVSPSRESKILSKVKENDGDKLFIDSFEKERSDTNKQYFRGETAVIYGEIGELMYMSTIKNPELKGPYTWQLLDGVLPHELTDALKNHPHDKDLHLNLFQRYIESEGREFDHDTIASFLAKEVDIVKSNHREWIEVKNLKNVLTWESLLHDHAGIYRQAEKLHRAIRMLGLEGKIKLKQTFINCIEKAAAIKFEESFGIQVVGCII